MKITISKSEGLRGNVAAPPSKSYTHRSIICASLAEGKSEIQNPLFCDDTNATIEICKRLGARIKSAGGILAINGKGKLSAQKEHLDCKGSGTTLRFFAAIAALAEGTSVLTGNDSLRRRPIGDLLQALGQLGVECTSVNNNGFPPIRVNGGTLEGGAAKLPGNVSSQFVSALLIVCPKAHKETTISVNGGLSSKQYVQMTIDVLKNFGIDIQANDELTRFVIPPMQDFKPRKFKVEGDFSSAAFFLAAGALSGCVEISNLNPASGQGDKEIAEILKRMGADITTAGKRIAVKKSKLKSVEIDMDGVPDLLPICAVLATQAKGRTKLFNASRLRIKESDRLSAISVELAKMGADIRELPDGIEISGPAKLKGATIDPHNDHRIAMACAVAGTIAEGKTIIQNAGCVEKSYPAFFEDLKKIGADVR